MPFEKNSKNKFSNLKFLLRKKKKSLCPWSKSIKLMKSKSSQTRPNPPKFIFWSEKIKIKLFNLVSFAAFIKLAMLFRPPPKKKVCYGKRQSLTTKLVVTLDYNLTQYLFNGSEFWQIYHWITSSSYILHACKSSRKLKINNYVINNLFKLQVFVF